MVIFPSFSIKVSYSVFLQIPLATGPDDLLPWSDEHHSVSCRLPECSKDPMLGIEVTHKFPVNLAKDDYRAFVSGLCQRHTRDCIRGESN